MQQRKIPIWTKEQQAKFAKRVREKDFPVSKHVAEVSCDGDALVSTEVDSRDGNWYQALKSIPYCQNACPELFNYYEAMKERLEEGKPEDWDGTYRATSK